MWPELSDNQSMALKVLDPNNALTSGSRLWVVSDLEKSHWARKIDWYLNFQLLRAEPHRSPELSPEIKSVMERWEFDAPEISIAERAPLMVASSKLLPNTQTVMVPLSAKEELWVKACHRIWQDLGRPTMRVFLPEESTVEGFSKHWPKADQEAAIELVADGEAGKDH